MQYRIKTESRCFLWAATCAALLAAGGCESETDALAENEALTLVTQAKPQPVVELKPNGVYFAEVTAQGTGCPAGSWNSSISSDGQVFTTTFSAYEIKVGGSDPTNATHDCAIEMKLRSTEEREFAVLSVFYSGYAFLEPGVTARQSVRYGFHGTSADAGNSRTDFTGPEDRDFLIRDDVGVDKQKWSACGIDHTLTASTQLRMQGGGPNATGYVNLSAVDGSLKLELRLGWRSCAQRGNGGKAPAQPSGATTAPAQPSGTASAPTQPGAAPSTPAQPRGNNGNGRNAGSVAGQTSI